MRPQQSGVYSALLRELFPQDGKHVEVVEPAMVGIRLLAEDLKIMSAGLLALSAEKQEGGSYLISVNGTPIGSAPITGMIYEDAGQLSWLLGQNKEVIQSLHREAYRLHMEAFLLRMGGDEER